MRISRGFALSAVLLAAAGCARLEGVLEEADRRIARTFEGLPAALPLWPADEEEEARASAAESEAAPAAPREGPGLRAARAFERAESDAARDAALEELRRLAKAGDAEAQYALGRAYGDGRGVPQNLSEANRLFLAAANQGHMRAEAMAGRAAYFGYGRPRDRVEAARRFERAADARVPEAEYQFGLMLMQGGAVSAEPARGLALLERAATAGHAQAQYAAGVAVSEGRGGPANAPWAARWYAKAAAQGVPSAQYMIGLYRIVGEALPRDWTRAYGWLTLAAREGVEAAEAMRVDLAERLDGPAREEGLAFADRFQATGAGGAFDDAPSVTFAQWALHGAGFDPGPVDGALGPKTTKALQDFQRSVGLAPDGVLGPRTLAALRRETDGAVGS